MDPRFIPGGILDAAARDDNGLGSSQKIATLEIGLDVQMDLELEDLILLGTGGCSAGGPEDNPNGVDPLKIDAYCLVDWCRNGSDSMGSEAKGAVQEEPAVRSGEYHANLPGRLP